MLVGKVQRRTFMTPPVSANLRQIFADNFRGRGMKRRDQVLSDWNKGRSSMDVTGSVQSGGRAQESAHRMPDIDDPRPPIIGWTQKQSDSDGTLRYLPVPNMATAGRKVLQGLYNDFNEMYYQHKRFVPIYGGGPWDPIQGFGHDQGMVARTATLVGCVRLGNNVWVMSNAVIRGDLNEVGINYMSVIMEGVVITTNGHPLNTHLPGRVSKINEGVCLIGKFCVIHPNTHIDSAFIDCYCEVGEGSTLGEGSMMELGSSLEPGSVLLANQRVPRHEIWGGNPARKVGNRNKNFYAWKGYVDKIVRYQVMGRAEEEAHGVGVNYVSATRSSENLQFHMDRQIEKNKHNLPEKVQEYIEKGTRDVPLWEEYKMVSRINVRPGSRSDYTWNPDPNKGKWMDKY